MWKIQEHYEEEDQGDQNTWIYFHAEVVFNYWKKWLWSEPLGDGQAQKTPRKLEISPEIRRLRAFTHRPNTYSLKRWSEQKWSLFRPWQRGTSQSCLMTSWYQPWWERGYSRPSPAPFWMWCSKRSEAAFRRKLLEGDFLLFFLLATETW